MSIARLLGTLAVVALVLMLGVQAEAQMGKKGTTSGMGEQLAMLSQSKVTWGANHEVTFTRYHSMLQSKEPDEFGTAARWEIDQASFDDPNTGTYSGHAVITHPDGDEMFQSYAGKIVDQVTNEDGSYKVTFEGTHWCTGGTKRLEGMQCSGKHKGTATPAGVTWIWDRTWELKQ